MMTTMPTTTTTMVRPMMMCHQSRQKWETLLQKRRKGRRTRYDEKKCAVSAAAAAASDDAKQNATRQEQLFAVGLGASTPSNVATLWATSEIENLGKRGTIATGQPFLDHMIDQLTTHAQLGVSVQVEKEHTETADPGNEKRKMIKCETDTAKYASDEDA